MYALVHEDMLKEIEHLDQETQGKVVLAYVNYQLYGVEPSKEDVLVYSIFKAKQEELNQKKTKAEVARENGKKGGRPRKDLSDKNLSKTKKTQTKPNHNPDITQAKPNKNQEFLEGRNQGLELVEVVNNQDEKSDSSVLYINNNINNKKITSDINYLIQELKDLTKELGIAYENKNERNFAKHILTAKDFGEFAEGIGMSRVEFAKNILRASVVINYRKGPCSGPMSIYQNYSEVYNKTRQQQQNRTVISIPTV